MSRNRMAEVAAGKDRADLEPPASIFNDRLGGGGGSNDDGLLAGKSEADRDVRVEDTDGVGCRQDWIWQGKRPTDEERQEYLNETDV